VNVSGGGVPKRRIESAWVGALGVAGDRQDDPVHHGGPDRAVCLYSLEVIQALQGEGHPIAPGTAGENLTLSGLEWSIVVPGTCLRAGSAVLEIVSYTVPCRTIRESFVEHRFGRISQIANPGWSRVYARVLEEGEVRVGDPVTVLAP